MHKGIRSVWYRLSVEKRMREMNDGGLSELILLRQPWRGP